MSEQWKPQLALSADELHDRHIEMANRWAPSMDPAELAKAAFTSAEERRRMAKNGQAMSDGSFPIPDVPHLRSAIKLARTPEQRAHVKKRAAALGKTDMIPGSW